MSGKSRTKANSDDANAFLDALEIPPCDCLPTWWGEWVDCYGQLHSVKLCKTRKVARQAYTDHMKEMGIKKGDRIGIIAIYPLCEHVLNADNGLTIQEWLETIQSWGTHFQRKDYREPVLKPKPTETWPGTAERIEVYRQRVERGLHLFHPHDLTQDARVMYFDGRYYEVDTERLGMQVSRNRNGSLQQLSLTISGNQ